jgi:hypothetical protein
LIAEAGTRRLSDVPFDRENALHVKRIAAVGGDEVVSIQARLLVNGSPVESPTSACGTLVVKTSSGSEPPPDINGVRVPRIASLLLEMTSVTVMTAVFMARSMSVGQRKTPLFVPVAKKQLELRAS